jgi:hypothetical protein
MVIENPRSTTAAARQAAFRAPPGDGRRARIFFGHEFCETLLPTPGALLDAYRRSCSIGNCGCSFSPKRLPNGPCGLCAIWDFCRIGVDCLKIVGREAHPHRKLLSLQLVNSVVQAVSEGRTIEDARGFARGLRETPDLCDSGYMCYYREAGLPAR